MYMSIVNESSPLRAFSLKAFWFHLSISYHKFLEKGKHFPQVVSIEITLFQQMLII